MTVRGVSSITQAIDDEVPHPTRRAEDPQPTRPWFSLRSLRAKLQLFSLLLVVVPGVLIAYLTVARARGALEQAVGRQLSEVAHDAIDELTTTLADERKNVRTWAHQDVMRDIVIGDLDKRVTRFLRSLVDNGAPYLDLLCVDRDGRVLAATDPGAIGHRVADAPWARAALGGMEFVAGPTPRSADGRPAVEIAAPIHDPGGSGAVIGALLGHYDWGAAMGAADRIRRTLLPHGLTVDVLVADRAGTVLGSAWRDDRDAPTRARLAAAGSEIIRRMPPAAPRGRLVDESTASLVGYERSTDPQLGWLALVSEPVDEAFRPVREMRRRVVVGLGLVLVGALGVATFFAARMSRPLRDLTRATQEIARAGEPRRPVVARSHDEIGELATAFNAMAAELKRAQDDLLVAAKFAFVGEVAAGVAHEVRTPLGILRSSAQMLERSLPPGEPRAAELAGMMIEEVDRLDRVVDGLLELARPHEPAVEATPLDAVLARALDFVQGQAREKGITLRSELAPHVARARCDPEQIYQVALNLIVNALQILPAGGTITVRTGAARGGRVAFEVRDDGPGIPPEVQECLFTPFFSQRPGGTGLGLALVQRVVQAHQGTVTVESDVGRGATFRVELPAAGGNR
ncbi:MAG: ATP-binding protein [Candidatus Binatia bacterium]